MYIETLDPLLKFWLVIVILLAAYIAVFAWIATLSGRRHKKRVRSRIEERDKRYWAREWRWRARNKVLVMLNRIRTPRLTDQRKHWD
ncbi:MAG: hypothetical protein P8J20_01445 [Novosphingobium sp.]|nr:hypothetical protein [Novosphingobium sp.]